MSFRLKHLFIATAVAALWLAVLQASPSIALITLALIVPSLVTWLTFLLCRARLSCSKNLLGAVLLTSWITTYLLFHGPFVPLIGILGAERNTFEIVYFPLLWLHENTVLQGPLNWYANIWGWQ